MWQMHARIENVCMMFYLDSLVTGITNMEDGKHGLDELQGTRIFTWAPSVSSK